MFYYLLTLTLIIAGCTNSPNAPETQDVSFGIFFLKDSTLKMNDIWNIKLDELKLSSNPWLSEKDIDFYDWSSHCIYLKGTKKSYSLSSGSSYLPKSWKDKPWIVVANGKKCYTGYFETISSVDFLPFPKIGLSEVLTYPNDIIATDWMFWFTVSDPRKNPDVRETLKNIGKYHGGLEVQFDTTNSPVKIFPGDTATVEYSIIIKNNDQNDLLVFDPDKLESSEFHHYTNGPNFLDITTNDSYGSDFKKTKPAEWSSEWYTLLKAGDLIKRTIRIKGYPPIPAGTYLIQFRYSAPRLDMEKSKREINENVRYWLGNTMTDTLRIYIP